MQIGTRALGTVLFVLLSGLQAQAGLLTSATWVGESFAEVKNPLFGYDVFPGTPFTLVTSGASLTASGSATGSSISMVSLTVAPQEWIWRGNGFSPDFLSQTLGGSQTLTGNGANQGVSGAFKNYIGVDTNGTLLWGVPLSVGVAGNLTTTSLIPEMGLIPSLPCLT